MLIERSKWGQLFDLIEQTLNDVATMPPGPVSSESLAERENNRVRYAALRAKMQPRSFDPAMSNEEFWNKVVAIPLWTNRPPKMGERIQATINHMKFSGEWLEDGPERHAMLSDPMYYERGPRREALEEALRKTHSFIRDNPGKSMVDLYIEEREFNEQTLRTIFERLWSLLDFGPVTTFHMMMELGLPVLKPDRAVSLVAVRLGLIRSYDKTTVRRGTKVTTTQVLPANLPQGRLTAQGLSNDVEFGWALQGVIGEMSAETGRSFREIDRLLVKMGAEVKRDDGLVRSVCATDRPACHTCLASSICSFGKFYRKESKKLEQQALAA